MTKVGQMRDLMNEEFDTPLHLRLAAKQAAARGTTSL